MTDMDKLSLYLTSKDTIEISDLKQLVNGSLKLDVDLLIQGFIERNKEKLLKHADVSLLEAEPYLILRSLIRQMVTFCEFMSHRAFAGSTSQNLCLRGLIAFGALSSPPMPCATFFSWKSVLKRGICPFPNFKVNFLCFVNKVMPPLIKRG